MYSKIDRESINGLQLGVVIISSPQMRSLAEIKCDEMNQYL